jgi:hypothetical protein
MAKAAAAILSRLRRGFLFDIRTAYY